MGLLCSQKPQDKIRMISYSLIGSAAIKTDNTVDKEIRYSLCQQFVYGY